MEDKELIQRLQCEIIVLKDKLKTAEDFKDYLIREITHYRQIANTAPTEAAGEVLVSLLKKK